ncbi:MAG TPA: MATE family efflux transporter [Fibrobacteria bacterium]|nr:MATE family efflux transporter [Fibrobacteria bacterium]
MILSSSMVTLMQLVDALVLSHHSSVAVAAMGPSSMAVILVQGLLFGTSGYAGTFVAHHHGANDSAGVRHATWLGIHVSWISGILALALAWPLGSLFLLAGHAPEVARQERIYSVVCLAGSAFPCLNTALAGWLSGIGKTKIVTMVSLAGFLVNAVLAWGLVLGRWGMPRLGIGGAALATVTAQAVSSLLFLALFARSGGLSDHFARRFDPAGMRRFLRLALPMGLRITGEVVAWTFFLIFLGRLGTSELAASSIAFRINGTAFFPAMGLGQAAGILVGQARGAGRDRDVPSICWQSMAVCEVWMLCLSLTFLLAAGPLVSVFAPPGPEGLRILSLGTVILRFVAFYCLFDAANVVAGCVLASAGDTAWVARAFFIGSAAFLSALWIADRFRPSLELEWTLATVFVLSTAVVWTLRFRGGAWRGIRVLEPVPEP